MKYYMVKVVTNDSFKWGISSAINPLGRRFIRIDTPYKSIGFIFSSGNAHYLREQSKQEQKMTDDYEHPKRKDGKRDMRYWKNRH